MKNAILAVLFLLSIATPAQASSAVSGEAVDIVGVQGMSEVWGITTRKAQYPFYVADTQHCGAPRLGPAYLQRVTLENGDQYNTLFTGSCAYEVWGY